MENVKKSVNENADDFMKRWQEEFGSFDGKTTISADDFFDEMKRMLEFE